MSNTKKQKNYLYHGLGFPILLEEAEFRNVGGKWLLKVNVQEIADAIIRLLPTKPMGLTGAEVRFIRTYFNLSKRGFAKELNVSHTAVNKWEDTDGHRAKIDPHVEIALRSFIKIKLQEEDDFSDFYKEMMEISKRFGIKAKQQPLSIAV